MMVLCIRAGNLRQRVDQGIPQRLQLLAESSLPDTALKNPNNRRPLDGDSASIEDFVILIRDDLAICPAARY